MSAQFIAQPTHLRPFPWGESYISTEKERSLYIVPIVPSVPFRHFRPPASNDAIARSSHLQPSLAEIHLVSLK